ncbi:hypothetical protein CR513_26622, partial [Mucuna pruriens]
MNHGRFAIELVYVIVGGAKEEGRFLLTLEEDNLEEVQFQSKTKTESGSETRSDVYVEKDDDSEDEQDNGGWMHYLLQEDVSITVKEVADLEMSLPKPVAGSKLKDNDKIYCESSKLNSEEEDSNGWNDFKGFKKNDKVRYMIVYRDGCKWTCLVNKVGVLMTYKLKIFIDVHTCGRIYNGTVATYRWVIGKLADSMKTNKNINLNGVIR